jgi:hypothetical protein
VRRWAALLAVASLAAACATAPRQPPVVVTEKPPPAPPAKPAKPAQPKEPAAPKPPALSELEKKVAELEPRVEARTRPLFERAQLGFPPQRLHLLAFKAERKLELWGESGGGPRFVRSYPVLRASGKGGPKLEQGDWQVPEGIYNVTWLNPRSAYYLSLKLGYPNAFDRARAQEEGRTNLGGDIFIHGRDLSSGCLAVGDEAVEDLFVLAAKVGIGNVRVIIAPNDLRSKEPPADLKYRPAWLPDLYSLLRGALSAYQLR